LEGLGDEKVSTCDMHFPSEAKSAGRKAVKSSLSAFYLPVNQALRGKPYNVVPRFYGCLVNRIIPEITDCRDYPNSHHAKYIPVKM